METKVFIQLFGPVSISICQQTHILTGSIAKLITLLALQEKTGFTFPRGRVAGYLWPDTTEEKARHLLSNTLYRLKNLLGDEAEILANTTDLVGLVDVDTDVIRFKELVNSQDPQDWYQAFELYQGDLAEDIDAGWVIAHRAELWEQYMTGLERACSLLWELSEFETGHLIAKKWVIHDPINEEAHYFLMRFLVKIGRQTAALLQYQKLENLLSQELGIEPLPHLKSFYAGLIAERSGGVSQDKKPRESFIGRQTERQQLIGYLNDLEKGKGGIVLLEADAGMGKTRLIEEMQASAELRHIQVAYGKGEDVAAPELLAPLSTALRQHYRPEWLAGPEFPSFSKRLLEPFLVNSAQRKGGNVPENLNRTVPFDTALRHLLESITQLAPLVLCLDDLHWGEASLWPLLGQICQVSRHQPLLVVLSYRPIELGENQQAHAALQTLEAEYLPHRMPLSGLALSEIFQLAAELESPLAPTRIEEIYHLSMGNPFIAKEFLLNDGEPSESLHELLQTRFQSLSEAAQQNLKAAVVLGNSFAYDVWQKCANGPIVLQELITGRFVVQNSAVNGYSFYHDFVRSMLYHSMDHQEKIERHLAATHVLIRAKASAEQIAWHCESANQLHEAVYYHQKAAEDSFSVHGYHNARRHIQAALQIGEQINLSQEAQLRLRLTKLKIDQISKQTAAGLDELKALEEMALLLEDGSSLIQIAQLKLLMLIAKGEAPEIRTATGQLVHTAEQFGDSREIVESMLLAADTKTNVLMESEETLEMLAGTFKIIEKIGQNEQFYTAAKIIESTAYLRFRKTDQASEVLADAERMIDEYGQLEPMRIRADYLATVIDQIEGRTVQAFNRFKASIYIYKMLDDVQGLISAMQNVGHIGMILGQHEEAIAASQELLNIANADSDLHNQRWARIRLADCYLMGGYLDEAEETLADVIPWLEAGGTGRIARRGWHAVGGLRFYQQRYQDSFDAYGRLIENVEDEKQLTQTPFLVYAETAKMLSKQALALETLEKVESLFDMTLRRTSTDMYRLYVFWFVRGDFEYLLDAWQTSFKISDSIEDEKIRRDYIERDPLFPFMQKAWYQETSPVTVELPSIKSKVMKQVDLTFDYGEYDEKRRAELGKVGLRQERIQRLLDEAAYRRVSITNGKIGELLGVNVRTIERDMQKLNQAASHEKMSA